VVDKSFGSSLFHGGSINIIKTEVLENEKEAGKRAIG
jgi:hypothetical protein